MPWSGLGADAVGRWARSAHPPTISPRTVSGRSSSAPTSLTTQGRGSCRRSNRRAGQPQSGRMRRFSRGIARSVTAWVHRLGPDRGVNDRPPDREGEPHRHSRVVESMTARRRHAQAWTRPRGERVLHATLGGDSSTRAWRTSGTTRSPGRDRDVWWKERSRAIRTRPRPQRNVRESEGDGFFTAESRPCTTTSCERRRAPRADSP